MAAVITVCSGCREDPPPPVDEGLQITGISIPSSINVPVGGEIILTGKGFEVNDRIEFALVSDAGKVYSSTVTAITPQSASFILPAGISSGTYRLTVIRGTESMLLGTLTVNVIVSTGIPDKPGMTIKGIVYCDGKGVPGVVIYGVPLGDMTWDVYWYDNNFRLDKYLVEMKKINCPMFNVIGNHDNDPYVAADIAAEEPFRDIIGPTWYSFNLGEVHYVVLDNIQYINTGGSQGVIGARNYNDVITSAQTGWLAKDLAAITLGCSIIGPDTSDKHAGCERAFTEYQEIYVSSLVA